MDDMESKLGAILGNPAMMQQIMALAQNFNQAPQDTYQSPTPADMDFTAIQKIVSLASGNKLGKQQLDLLQALRPYLSHNRIDRLQRAMQAAKLANAATALLGTMR